MMNSALENALKENWEKKEKFYEDTKDLTMIEILEKIEGKKFNSETYRRKTAINSKKPAPVSYERRADERDAGALRP
jgi:hypothetical protein